MENRRITWIEPEETIDSGQSAFVDDYFAHEEYYENKIVDTSYIKDRKLQSQVEMLFGDDDFF